MKTWTDAINIAGIYTTIDYTSSESLTRGARKIAKKLSKFSASIKGNSRYVDLDAWSELAYVAQDFEDEGGIEDANHFNMLMSQLYNWADDNNVWVETYLD